MKKIYSLLLTVIITTLSLFAQAPQKMSYQAVIRGSENQLVVGTEIGMRISILHGSADGTSVYIETQTPTTNANGLVSIEIGSGTIQSGNFSAIDWSDGPYFMKTETDPSGGTDYTITGTSQLLSVPYAFHATTVENLTETDPLFAAWDKSTGIMITESQVTDLQAYLTAITGESIGNLADVDLTEIAADKVLKYDDTEEKWVVAHDLGLTEETDPLFEASPAADIESADIGNWNEAYDWGDHSEIGYLTEYVESDPTWEGEGNHSVTIGRTGYVGIGTVNPSAQLEVSGMMKLSPMETPVNCNENIEGSLYYDQSLKTICYCNGTHWYALDGTNLYDKFNLIVNGDMEEWTIETIPENWIVSGTSVHSTINQVEGYTSTWAVQLADMSINEVLSLHQDIYQEGSLPSGLPGETMVLSLWTRKSAGIAIGRACIEDGSITTCFALPSLSEWVQSKFIFEISTDATLLRIVLYPTGADAGESSTYDFDGVGLVPEVYN